MDGGVLLFVQVDNRNSSAAKRARTDGICLCLCSFVVECKKGLVCLELFCAAVLGTRQDQRDMSF